MKGVAILIAVWVLAAEGVAASEQVKRYYSNMYDKTARFTDRQARLEYQDCVDHVKIKHKEGASEDPRFQGDLEKCAKDFQNKVVLAARHMLTPGPIV